MFSSLMELIGRAMVMFWAGAATYIAYTLLPAFGLVVGFFTMLIFAMCIWGLIYEEW